MNQPFWLRKSRYYIGVAALATLVALTLASCGTPSHFGNIHATQPARPTASTQIVQVTVAVQQRGTVALRIVTLDLDVTVRNQTPTPLHLWYICGFDPIVVQVLPVGSQQSIVAQNTYSCPPGPTIDFPPTILAGASHTFHLTADLSASGGVLIQQPQAAEYVIAVSFNWRPGAAGQAPPPGGRDEKASGATTFTLH
ncbi:MAG: hypothetical protein OJF49_001746 [Ktedonobacterales bacterium]|jgi:hypothetical protein|nr:MAG: hypothetical protein OJF49_001746 [Ktedonobacterales bacterium]